MTFLCVGVGHVCLCVQLLVALELHPCLGHDEQCCAHRCASVRSPCPRSFLHILREAPCKWRCVCPGCSTAWLPPPCIVCDARQVAEPCSFVQVSTVVHPPSCRWTDTPGGCSGWGVRAWGASVCGAAPVPCRLTGQASGFCKQATAPRAAPWIRLLSGAGCNCN